MRCSIVPRISFRAVALLSRDISRLCVLLFMNEEVIVRDMACEAYGI